MHVTSSHHHIFSQQLTYYLEQVLHEIKKEQLKSGPHRERLPITADLMEKIDSVLSYKMQDYNNVLIWAVAVQHTLICYAAVSLQYP